MKHLLRTAAATTGVVTVLASALVTAGTATADDTPSNSQSGVRVIAQAHTEGGGWVEYAADDSSSDFSAQAVEEVGGGIWSYGATYNAAGQKVCYSQYRHETEAHGSSVSMDGSTDSDWVGPGAVSNASVTKYTTATCRAYWRK